MRGFPKGRPGFGTPTRLIVLGAFVTFAKVATAIRALAYVGSVGLVNVAVGWTMLGISGCHGGCCCAI